MTATLTARPDEDRSLLARVADGDSGAVEAFLLRHRRWVRSVVYAALGRPDEVDDVCQQVWLTVWRRAASPAATANPRGWLYRVARNAALDARRKRRRRLGLLDGLFRRFREGRASHGPDPAGEAMGRERRRAIRSAIEALPEIYREVLVLKVHEGWSYRRIAETLGLSLDGVETRLARARRMLREKLSRGEA